MRLGKKNGVNEINKNIDGVIDIRQVLPVVRIARKGRRGKKFLLL